MYMLHSDKEVPEILIHSGVQGERHSKILFEVFSDQDMISNLNCNHTRVPKERCTEENYFPSMVKG
jgi:hypothetical protein